LKLSDDTAVYPANAYKGQISSTIGEERRFNPRLRVYSRQQYTDQTNALSLDPPRLVEVVVPANRRCGLKMAA
jgi:sulfur dioxygenase